MNDIIETPSLIPYLKTDGTKFHIKVAVGNSDDSINQNPRSLFWLFPNQDRLHESLEQRLKRMPELILNRYFY